jgi:hypothetical protein
LERRWPADQASWGAAGRALRKVRISHHGRKYTTGHDTKPLNVLGLGLLATGVEFIDKKSGDREDDQDDG